MFRPQRFADVPGIGRRGAGQVSFERDSMVGPLSRLGTKVSMSCLAGNP